MTRPRALRLDHFANGARGLGAGRALLAAALLAAAALGAWQQALQREFDALEARASRDARSGGARAVAVAMDPRRLEEAERRASLIALELRLPWNELFNAVEEATDPAVALLAVEPDARRSALRVSGEARDKEAMLRYVKRLGAQPPIVRALLESHAERRTGGSAAVQFTLVAYWGSQP
ncbi:MAG: hypothetical protein OEW90_09535 [Betaproteobacteria bacterium]|nr:hypothetical protein [Betaproteobacteria bacterium]